MMNKTIRRKVVQEIRHLIDGEELTGTPEVNTIARRLYESGYEHFVNTHVNGGD